MNLSYLLVITGNFYAKQRASRQIYFSSCIPGKMETAPAGIFLILKGSTKAYAKDKVMELYMSTHGGFQNVQREKRVRK